MINEQWVSSWDDVYSMKTYDLPNLESPNWFVSIDFLNNSQKKVIPITLSHFGCWWRYCWAIRLVIEMHISGEVPKKKPVGKWLGLCNRNPDTHVSGECRQPVPRTASAHLVISPRGVNRVLTPSTLSTNAFRNVRFTKSKSVFICKFWHFCHNISSITIGLICRSYNKFTLFI